jgi:hypothetical protein
VRDFVTIAHKGFAQREISCHDHYLRTGEKGLLRTPSREDSLNPSGVVGPYSRVRLSMCAYAWRAVNMG